MREPVSRQHGRCYSHMPQPSTQKCTTCWRWDLHHSLSQSIKCHHLMSGWYKVWCAHKSKLQPQSWWNATACHNIDETQVKNPGRKYYILQEYYKCCTSITICMSVKSLEQAKTQRQKVAEGVGAKEEIRTDYLTSPRVLSGTAEIA